MQTLINVGDVIDNDLGDLVKITGVRFGKYGIHLQGVCDTGSVIWDYLPYELPPSKSYYYRGLSWYNWVERGKITLPNGMELGDVCLTGGRTADFEFCEAEWERTVEQINKELKQALADWRNQ